MTMTKLPTKSQKSKKPSKRFNNKSIKAMDFDKEIIIDHAVDVDMHLYDQFHLEVKEEPDALLLNDDEEHTTLELEKKIKKRKIKEEKKKYYVDNDRFQELIAHFYKTDIFSDELAMILYNIANRVAFMPNFINYSYKDEMIGDGLLKEIQTIKNKKFDISRGKAFNYFTTIVWNAFIGKIKSEQKEHAQLREHQSRQYDMLTSGMKITSSEHNDSSDF